MYTYEQRMTAVKLYIKYFHRASAVIRELGYPNRHVLVNWYKEYEATGDLHRTSQQGKHQKFTEDQKRIALEFYQEHGRSFTLTVRALGYPGMTTLKEWVNEAFPNRKKYCISGGAMVKFPQEKKEQAVTSLNATRSTMPPMSSTEIGSRHLSSPKQRCSPVTFRRQGSTIPRSGMSVQAN